MSTSLEAFSVCSVSLHVLAFNGRIVLACLWTYALAFTSLVSHSDLGIDVCMCQLVSTLVPRAPHSLM